MKAVLVRSLRVGIYALWAISLTALTYVFGALPIKLLRTSLGRVGYALAGFSLVGLFAVSHNSAMAIALASLFVLIGIYTELEDTGLAFVPSALSTLAVSTLLTAGGFAMWVVRVGPGWRQVLLQGITDLERPILDRFPSLSVNTADFVTVAPSVILGLWMTALCGSVWFERVWRQKNAEANPLNGFRLPDFVVWVFIASVLGRYGDFGSMWLSSVSYNVMNGCLILFFFQGIAVALKFFEVIRAPWPLQVFSAVFLLYGSVMISFLGLLDFWFDFRTRLIKRGATLNRQV